MNRFTAKSNQKTDSFLGISCVFNSNEMENFKTVRCNVISSKSTRFKPHAKFYNPF